MLVLSLIQYAECYVFASLHAGDTIVAVDDQDQVVDRYLLDTVTSSYGIVQSEDAAVLDDLKYAKMMKDKVQLRDSRDWYVDHGNGCDFRIYSDLKMILDFRVISESLKLIRTDSE